MPAPKVSEVPKQEYWGFIQQNVDSTDLVALANNLVLFDGKVLDDAAKTAILAFLGRTDAVQKWSDLWITIINTLGLAYVTVDDVLHKTKLASFLAEGGSETEFYLLWSLLFQFPFAQTKHKEFKENGVVVNPCQIILTSLAHLVYVSLNTEDRSPFREAYLSPEEVVLVLMKLRSNDTYEIIEKTNIIYKNRKNNFDYETLKLQGHDAVIDNFANRARLYFEKSGIIKYNANRNIYIQDWKHFCQCQSYLSYRIPGLAINIETEEKDRIRFFEKTFNGAELPRSFYNKVHDFDSRIDNVNVEVDEVKALTSRLSDKGYTFSHSFIERFLLAAKTKPFIILSGISGVGKSLLPNTLMKILNSLGGKAIAVSPDWTDNSDMLGYFGADNEFVAGEFANFLVEAGNSLHTPFFIVLDEMNLAKVEFYFAQALSVMETRHYDQFTDKATYSYLFNDGVRKRLTASGKESDRQLARLKIPGNVVVVGTVNIDESTHPFSKKVLDRANVLEIDDVNLAADIDGMQMQERKVSILPFSKNYVGCITNLKELQRHWTINMPVSLRFDFIIYIKRWVAELEKFNIILKRHHLNFGFRVRDEVCIYMYYAAIRNVHTSNDNWDLKYFDQQLIQKVLTKFEGEEGEVEETIEALFKLCLVREEKETQQVSILSYSEIGEADFKYPLTARKLKNMFVNLEVYRKPMVSFWTS
jgi:hypothetical protein